jgi:peroxin-16
MGIQKRLGSQKSDKAVLAIESIKALLRLALMNATGGRTSLQPPLPEREIDPSSILEKYNVPITIQGEPPFATVEFPTSSADLIRNDGSRNHPDYWKGIRTGTPHPTLASLRPSSSSLIGDAAVEATGGKAIISAFLMTKVLTIEDAKRPEDLIMKAQGLAQFAEILWILRPVIYGELMLYSFFPHERN